VKDELAFQAEYEKLRATGDPWCAAARRRAPRAPRAHLHRTAQAGH
jgi:hypothetical protein